MNKLQGYLICTKNQTQAASKFLKQADGCDYIIMPAVEAELVQPKHSLHISLRT